MMVHSNRHLCMRNTKRYFAVAALLSTRTESFVTNTSIKSFGLSTSKSNYPSFRCIQSEYFRQFTMSSEASVTEKELLDVSKNYNDVNDRVKKASERSCVENVRLVAVSKTKPIELLKAAYDGGCRCFGENYVQEMVDKVPKMPNDIEWHFIGALQSNKCNTLVKAMDGSVERLTVETVSSTKLANKLNTAFESDNQRLKVFVQVNTSGEDSKSGVEPGAETVDLCRHIVETCPKLDLRGLMTIGAIGDESCFARLAECKKEVEQEIPTLQNLELSMGMSGDFEIAIAAGATNVRVGSTIFGERDYSK